MTDGEGGSWALDAPRNNKEWSGSFGLYILCTTTGQSVKLEKVTWKTRVEPAQVKVFVRHIPSRDKRAADKDYAPIGMLEGLPAAHPEWGGSFVDYKGQRVDQRCSNGQPDVNGPRDDLVVSLTADSQGAALDGFTVEYSSEGRRYALDVAWSMALCGSAITEGC